MFYINYISIIFFFTAVIAFILAIISNRKKEIEGIEYFTLTTLCFMVWAFFSSLEYASIDISQKIFFSKLTYLGIAPSTLSLLLFALKYSGYDKNIPIKYVRWLYLVSLFFIISGLTNDLHFFQWKSYQVRESLVGKAVYYESGTGVWMLVVFSYLSFLSAFFLLGLSLLKRSQKYWKEYILLLLAMLAPMITNVLYIMRLIPYDEIDWTPATYTLSAIFIYLSIRKNNILVLTPLAKDLLYNSIQSPIIVINHEFALSDFNPAADRLFKLNNKIGSHVCTIITEVKCEAITNNNTGNLNICRNTELGEIWLSLSISSVRNHKNIIKGYLLLFTDITQQKKDSQLIAESEQKIREHNAFKDKLLSIIGHDLRNPFNSILGLAEILIKEPLTDENRIKYLSYIKRSAGSASFLLENLLDWAQNQSDNKKFTPKLIFISHLIDEAVSLNESHAKLKAITLSINSQDRLQTECDRNMVYTIIRNLISNAIKFSFAGSKIEISLEENGDFHEIAVKDYGIGMTEDEMNLLFHVTDSKQKYGTNNEKGTGLGLILCKELAEKHGGKLLVKSEPKQGSTFTVMLPAVQNVMNE